MGNFSFLLWAISFWFRHWKNFKNRPTFAKVPVKIEVAQFFLTHSVLPLDSHLWSILLQSRLDRHSTCSVHEESWRSLVRLCDQCWCNGSDQWIEQHQFQNPKKTPGSIGPHAPIHGRSIRGRRCSIEWSTGLSVNARLGLEPTVETSAWNVGSSTGRGLSVDDQKIAALFAVARDSQWPSLKAGRNVHVMCSESD